MVSSLSVLNGKYLVGIKSVNSVMGTKLNVPRESELVGVEPVLITTVTWWAPHTAWWKILAPTASGGIFSLIEISAHLKFGAVFKPRSAGWIGGPCWI